MARKALLVKVYLTALVLSMSVLTQAGSSAMATHYHSFPGDPNSPLERNFGFVTTITSEGVHGSPHPTEDKDIDQIRSLDESFSTGTLKVRTTNSPVGASGFLSALTSGMTAWEAYKTYTDQPEWTVLQDNLDVNLPSIFTDCGGFGGADGDFEAAFCSRGLDDPIAEVEYSPSFAVMATDGGQDTFDEADIAFNLDIDLNGDGVKDPWTQTLLNNVARHEIGHLYGLGDLYGLYDSNTICNLNEAAFGNGLSQGGKGPAMCDDDNPVSIGDANGLFYLYPNAESVSLTETYGGAAGDLAVADLDGDADNTEPEFIVVEIDEETISGSTDIQHFILKPFLDVDENTYSEGSGVQEELFTRSTEQIFDVGLSVVNIGGGSRPEMIVSWVQSGEDAFYKVYWDIFLSSGNLNWAGTPSTTYTITTTALEGLDTVFMNMDGDAAKEMVVIQANTGTTGEPVIGYRHTELNPTTGAPGTWTTVTDTGILIDDDRVGAAIIDDAARLVAVVYHAEGLTTPEYMGYKVLRFTTSGTVEMSSTRQLTTLEQSDDDSTAPDGVGADAYLWANVGASVDTFLPAHHEYRDLVVMTFDGGSVEFTVERDTRYNAHGTDDNTGRQ
jgi:hypothetical protein